MRVHEGGSGGEHDTSPPGPQGGLLSVCQGRLTERTGWAQWRSGIERRSAAFGRMRRAAGRTFSEGRRDASPLGRPCSCAIMQLSFFSSPFAVAAAATRGSVSGVLGASAPSHFLPSPSLAFISAAPDFLLQFYVSYIILGYALFLHK